MNNVHDLRKELSELYAKIKSKEIPPSQAAEMNNTAGKLISTFKLELDAYALAKETPPLDFYRAPETEA